MLLREEAKREEMYIVTKHKGHLKRQNREKKSLYREKTAEGNLEKEPLLFGGQFKAEVHVVIRMLANVQLGTI